VKIVSLFDGISCGMVALERSGIPVERYVAYEIEPNAIAVSKDNYPLIEHCGDVTVADFTKHQDVDLLIGGSPCQDFSTLSRTRDGLDGSKSHLFWEFARALKEARPKYFLLENNASMPSEAKKIISRELGVDPIRINSSLVSGQYRNRLYWTNIPNVLQPHDKNILLGDLIKKYPWYNEIKLTEWTKKKVEETREKFGYIPDVFCPYVCTEIKDKHYCLTAQGNSQTKSSTNLLHKDGKFYMFNADFWEVLQTLPVGYTKCLGKENKRKTVIGNSWTVDVIAHIFTNLKEVQP
jgi:DNA (cytosine-5)-methyltransferase 3A